MQPARTWMPREAQMRNDGKADIRFVIEHRRIGEAYRERRSRAGAHACVRVLQTTQQLGHGQWHDGCGECQRMSSALADARVWMRESRSEHGQDGGSAQSERVRSRPLVQQRVTPTGVQIMKPEVLHEALNDDCVFWLQWRERVSGMKADIAAGILEGEKQGVDEVGGRLATTETLRVLEGVVWSRGGRGSTLTGKSRTHRLDTA